MTTVTWRGGSAGNWSVPTNWTGFTLPQAGDDVVIGPDTTVTLHTPASVADIAIGTGSSLEVGPSLTLSGIISGAVQNEGTITGGTLAEMPVGIGVVDGVTLPDAPWNYISITPATVAVNAMATIMVADFVGLAAGTYVNSFTLSANTDYSADLWVSGDVTLSASATVDLATAGNVGPAAESTLASGLQFSVVPDGMRGTLVQVSDTALTAQTDFNRTPGADYGVFTLDGGTLAVGDLQVEGSYTVELSQGAVWQTGTIGIGAPVPPMQVSETFFGEGSLRIDGGTLTASAIVIGLPETGGPPGRGTLSATGGASVVAGTASLDLSSVVIDATSSVVIGQAAATLGALTVSAGATLETASGGITGDLRDAGDILIDSVFDRGPILSPLSVSGDVTISSTLSTGAYGYLAVGGSLEIAPGGMWSAIGSGFDTVAGQVVLDAATASAVAAQALLNGSFVTAGGMALGAGATLTVLGDAVVTLTGGGPLAIGAGATLVAGSGTIDGNVSDAGALLIGPILSTDGSYLSPGSLVVTGDLSLDAATLDILAHTTLDVQGTLGGDAVTVEAGGSLSVGTLDGDLSLSGSATIGAVAAAPTITLQTTAAALTLEDQGALGLTLVGVQAGGQIDFAGLRTTGGGVASATLANGTLNVIGASGQTASVALVDTAAGHNFHAVPDGLGGTLVQVSDPLPLTAQTDFAGTPYTDYGKFALDAATVSVGSIDVQGTYTIDLLDGALWQTGDINLADVSIALSINVPTGGNGALLLNGGGSDGGTLDAGKIAVGSAPQGYVSGAGAGTLAAVNGAVIVASGLALNFSSLTLDATSSMTLGTAPATAGALTVGADAGLDVVQGSITGNLIDNGGIGIGGYFDHGQVPTVLSVYGNVTVASTLVTGAYGFLDVGGGLTVLQGGTYEDSPGDTSISGTLVLDASQTAGPGALVKLDQASAQAVGVLVGGGASLVLDDGSSLTLFGNAPLMLMSGATLSSNGGTIDGSMTDAGTVLIAPVLSTDGSYLSPGSLVVTGDLALDAATLDILAHTTLDVQGTLGGGGITVETGGGLSVGTLDHDLSLSGSATIGAVAAAPTITLHTSAAALTLGAQGSLGLTVLGAVAGDQIDFAGVSATGAGAASATLANGTLNVTGASGQTASVALVDTAAGHNFHAVPDGLGGTLVQVLPPAASSPLLAATSFDRTPGVDYGAYALGAGTLADGPLAVRGNYVVQLAAGALWQASGIGIGQTQVDPANPAAFQTGDGSLAIVGGGSLGVAGTLTLGSDAADGTPPMPAGGGRLSVTGGSTVSVSQLALLSGTLSLDGASSLVIGQSAPTAGALTLAAGATLQVSDGAIDGSFIDRGSIAVAPLPADSGQSTGLAISGDFTVLGSLAIAPLAAFGVGGSLYVRNGGSLAWNPGDGHSTIGGGVTLGVAGGGAGLAGTLSVAAGVGYGGGLSLFGGSVLSVAPGGSLNGYPGGISLNQGATLTVDSGTIEGDLYLSGFQGGTLDLLPSALPQAGLTMIGNFYNDAIDIQAGATLHVQGTLSSDIAFWEHQHDVTVEAGGSLSVRTLDSSITLDGTANIGDVTYGQTITFGNDSGWLSIGRNNPPNLTLIGLRPGDHIDFTSVSSVPNGQFGAGAAAMSGGALLLTGASGATASLTLGDSPDAQFTVAPDGHGGSLVTAAANTGIPCYVAGTHILAEHGEQAVETLRAGDLVRTASGRLAPVRWVGRTRIDLARHSAPERAAPIRVAAGAIAPGVPRRDLLLSRDHALYLDGALVPVWQLANGASIARQDGLAAVTYYHVELDRHDILLAEGCPAESYLDTGNRGLFANAAGVRPLHPEFGGPDPAALRIWAERAAAPLLLGTAARPLHTRLRARAKRLGWEAGGDPAPHVLIGGQRIDLHAAAPGLWQAHVPVTARTLRLRSRSFVPAETQRDSGDTRRLGLAVRAVLLGGRPLPQEAFGDGWHPAESADSGWRWSDGDAGLSLPPDMRPSWLEVRVESISTARYWATTRTARLAPANAAMPAGAPPAPASRTGGASAHPARRGRQRLAAGSSSGCLPR